MALKTYEEMRKIDVTPYCEERDGMIYLNWAKCIDLLHENGGRPFIIPSAAYKKYEKACKPFMPKVAEPIDYMVQVESCQKKCTRKPGFYHKRKPKPS